MRTVFVLLHRYLGLAMAGFLALAGLTGAILAFHHEIDEWLNPQFYTAPGDGEVLDLAALAGRAAADHPKLDILYIESEGMPGHPALAVGEARATEAGAAPPAIDYNFVYLDPVTGETLATRYWARCCFEPENFIPFIYEFHHTLTLPGIWAYLVMGVVGILWTVDCFIALALTFPRGRPFFAKWGIAWRIKRGAGAYRLNLDLHRGAGLWLWLILLPLAVSSVAMNLPEQVFKPVVSLFSPVEPDVYHTRGTMTAEELGTTALSFGDILARGRRAAAGTLELQDPIHAIYFNRALNYFAVGYGDHHDKALGNPWLFFDGTSGAVIQRLIPGEGSAGEIFVQLQYPIHSGQIAGLAGRIVICLTGLAIFMLSITGVVIWWKKRKARSGLARHAATRLQAQTSGD